jgi:hypothetical protein
VCCVFLDQIEDELSSLLEFNVQQIFFKDIDLSAEFEQKISLFSENSARKILAKEKEKKSL